MCLICHWTTHSSHRWCHSLNTWSHCENLSHSVMITCWSSSTKVSRRRHGRHPLKDTANGVIDWFYMPAVEATCSENLTYSQVYTGVFLAACAVLLQGPRVALTSCTKVGQKTVTEHLLSIHCSPWLDDGDAILARSWYADWNYDSALNSSLRHVGMHERYASSVWLKPRRLLLWLSAESRSLTAIFTFLLSTSVRVVLFRCFLGCLLCLICI